MDLLDRWAILYYEWSLERAEEEFKKGFPLLSLVRGKSAFRHIEYVQGLDKKGRERLPCALVKRFNLKAVKLKGHALDAEEENLVRAYLNLDKTLTAGERLAALPYASEKERAFAERINSGVAQKGKSSQVRKDVSRRLEELLGTPTSKPSGIVVYQTHAPGWRLRTLIDYGGNFGQITYAHSLIPEGLYPLQPPIHLCGWMGIAGQTTWDLYTSDETGLVADSILTMISWFAANWMQLARSLGDAI